MGLHNKPPGSSVGTPPHQDNFYWCRKPSNALTAYVALTDQSFKNGGIGYLPGSHLGKIHKHYKSQIKAFSSYIKLNKCSHRLSATQADNLGPVFVQTTSKLISPTQNCQQRTKDNCCVERKMTSLYTPPLFFTF